MTKEEILEYIKYSGEYTTDVKKRLNKLIKKYHPDNNKKDKDTILILYDVKKELENNTLEYKKKEVKNVEEDKENNLFLEAILKKLKEEKEKINNEINSLYRKINKLINTKNDKQDELYKAEYNVLNLENELNELSEVDLLDKTILLFTMFFGVILLFYRNMIFLLVIIILLLIESYYIYIRYSAYKDKKKIVRSVRKSYKKIENEYKEIETNIEKLEKEEVKLKRKRAKINGDIYRYSKELSNVKDNENTINKKYDKRK